MWEQIGITYALLDFSFKTYSSWRKQGSRDFHVKWGPFSARPLTSPPALTNIRAQIRRFYWTLYVTPHHITLHHIALNLYTIVRSLTQWVPASNEGVPLGCLVTALTLSHVRPVGSITRGEVATKRGIGMYTTRLFCGMVKLRRRSRRQCECVFAYVIMYVSEKEEGNKRENEWGWWIREKSRASCHLSTWMNNEEWIMNNEEWIMKKVSWNGSNVHMSHRCGH